MKIKLNRFLVPKIILSTLTLLLSCFIIPAANFDLHVENQAVHFEQDTTPDYSSFFAVSDYEQNSSCFTIYYDPVGQVYYDSHDNSSFTMNYEQNEAGEIFETITMNLPQGQVTSSFELGDIIENIDAQSVPVGDCTRTVLNAELIFDKDAASDASASLAASDIKGGGQNHNDYIKQYMAVQLTQFFDHCHELAINGDKDKLESLKAELQSKNDACHQFQKLSKIYEMREACIVNIDGRLPIANLVYMVKNKPLDEAKIFVQRFADDWKEELARDREQKHLDDLEYERQNQAYEEVFFAVQRILSERSDYDHEIANEETVAGGYGGNCSGYIAIRGWSSNERGGKQSYNNTIHYNESRLNQAAQHSSNLQSNQKDNSDFAKAVRQVEDHYRERKLNGEMRDLQAERVYLTTPLGRAANFFETYFAGSYVGSKERIAIIDALLQEPATELLHVVKYGTLQEAEVAINQLASQWPYCDRFFVMMGEEADQKVIAYFEKHGDELGAAQKIFSERSDYQAIVQSLVQKQGLTATRKGKEADAAVLQAIEKSPVQIQELPMDSGIIILDRYACGTLQDFGLNPADFMMRYDNSLQQALQNKLVVIVNELAPLHQKYNHCAPIHSLDQLTIESLDVARQYNQYGNTGAAHKIADFSWATLRVTKEITVGFGEGVLQGAINTKNMILDPKNTLRGIGHGIAAIDRAVHAVDRAFFSVLDLITDMEINIICGREDLFFEQVDYIFKEIDGIKNNIWHASSAIATRCSEISARDVGRGIGTFGTEMVLQQKLLTVLGKFFDLAKMQCVKIAQEIARDEVIVTTAEGFQVRFADRLAEDMVHGPNMHFQDMPVPTGSSGKAAVNTAANALETEAAAAAKTGGEAMGSNVAGAAPKASTGAAAGQEVIYGEMLTTIQKDIIEAKILRDMKIPLENLAKNGNKIKKIEDKAFKVWHTFSKDHEAAGILAIGISRESIITQFIDVIKKADMLNLLKEGPNNIWTHINGIPIEIRVFIRGETLINFNAFVEFSSRNVKNLIKI